MTETLGLAESLVQQVPTVSARIAGVVDQATPARSTLERLRSHLVIVPTAGRATYLVDFDLYELGPGMLLHVQPGQVAAGPDGEMTGWVLSIAPATCPDGLFRRSEPEPVVELGEVGPIIAALSCDLAREQQSQQPNSEVMLDGAALLLRHVAQAANTEAALSHHGELVRAYRAEIERNFAVNRSVSAYARLIGASTKTLSRATLRVTGRSPKELIDRRVTLEAKRMLVSTDDPIASIGLALGFTEATNFTKFFARNAGQTPMGFRLG